MFRMLRQIAHDLKEKVATVAEPELRREDVGLPMGAHIGALMKFDGAVFDRFEFLGSLISRPEAGESTIRSIARTKMGSGSNFRCFRYFTENGDGDKRERFLQVFEQDGEVVERCFLSSIHRHYPNEEEIRYYRGDLGVQGIGGPEWVFDNMVWLRSVLPKEVAASIPSNTTEIVWKRESPGDGWITPTKCVEDRIDDSYGDKGHKQTLHMMSYVRQLADGQSNEFLVITLEMSETRVHVDFMIGIPLAVTDVQVIPTKV